MEPIETQETDSNLNSLEDVTNTKHALVNKYNNQIEAKEDDSWITVSQNTTDCTLSIEHSNKAKPKVDSSCFIIPQNDIDIKKTKPSLVKECNSSEAKSTADDVSDLFYDSSNDQHITKNDIPQDTGCHTCNCLRTLSSKLNITLEEAFANNPSNNKGCCQNQETKSSDIIKLQSTPGGEYSLEKQSNFFITKKKAKGHNIEYSDEMTKLGKIEQDSCYNFDPTAPGTPKKQNSFDNKAGIKDHKDFERVQQHIKDHQNVPKPDYGNSRHRTSPRIPSPKDTKEKDIRIKLIRERLAEIDANLKFNCEERDKLIRANPNNCNAPVIISIIQMINVLLTDWFKLNAVLDSMQ